MNIRRRKMNIGFIFLYFCIFFSVAALLLILFYLFYKSASVLNWNFLVDMPRNGMTAGGIFPAIVGTLYLTIGAIVFSLPLGILGAVYISEYAREGLLLKIIRIGINNLNGVPSIVFGLFGFAVFVRYFHFGISILSGSLTLGILILPMIIATTEEALKAVPLEQRLASYSLGAGKWETIIKVVLPEAFSGILTGVILSIGRAAGETAPLLYTAATFYQYYMPNSIFSEVQALPFHIYALITEGLTPSKQIPIAYGTAAVLVTLVLLINITAIYIRIKLRRKKWARRY